MAPGDFLLTNPLGFMIDVLIFSCIFLLHRHITRRLFQIKIEVFQACLIGLSINAILISTLISFNMFFTHFYLWLVLGSLIFIELYHQFTKFRNRVKFSVFRGKPSVTFIFFCTILLVQYSSFLSRDFRIINAHWAYYFGLPAEILKGDYSHRIRIFDNFPATYPKYHFFNSGQLAILMRPLHNISYVDFSIARMVVVTLGITALFEMVLTVGSMRRYIFPLAVVFSLGITSLAPSLYWSLSSTNYTNILFFLLFLVSYRLHRTSDSILWLAIFSLTSIRSLFPALLIASSLCFSKRKEILIFLENKGLFKSQIFLRFTLLFFVVVVSQFSMVFSGTSNEVLTLSNIGYSLSHPTVKFINPGWLSVMSGNIFGSDASTDPGIPTVLSQGIYWWLVLVIISIFLFPGYSKSRYWKFSFLIYVITFAIAILAYILQDYWTHGVGVLAILIYYIVPALSALFLSNHLFRVILPIFILASLLQVLLLPGEIGIPNWSLIEWVWLIAIAESLYKLKIGAKLWLKSLISGLCILMICFPPVSPKRWFQPTGADSTSHKITHPETLLSVRQDCIFSNEDGLLNSLSGHRNYFSPKKSDRFSITKNFVNKNESVKLPRFPFCQLSRSE